MAGNQWMRAGGLVVLIGLLAGCKPAATDPAMPGWMAGAWREQKGDGWAEEYWTGPRAGLMMGSGRNGTGDALDSWEYMRIVKGPKGAITFIAAPEGASRATEFPMVKKTATSVEFADPQHDFPQRIRYWREGGTLHAEIAMLDGTKAMRWTFVLVGR